MKSLNPVYLAGRVRHYGYGRTVVAFAKRARIPIGTAFAFIRATKRIASPVDWYRRSRIGFLEGSPWVDAVPQATGWRQFGPGEIPGSIEMAAACRRLAATLERKTTAVGGTYVDLLCADGPTSSGLILSPFDYSLVPGLLDFALSDPIVHAATGYLRQVPVIGGITLYASLPNDALEGPQKFHRDQVDTKMFKALLAVNDIDADTGPFTFIPADKSRYVRRKLRYQRGRLEDDQLFSVISPPEQVAFTGQAGSVLFVDSSQCLHHGSRRNTKSRLLLEIMYCSRFHQAESSRRFTKQIYDPAYFSDPFRRALLAERPR